MVKDSFTEGRHTFSVNIGSETYAKLKAIADKNNIKKRSQALTLAINLAMAYSNILDMKERKERPKKIKKDVNKEINSLKKAKIKKK